MLTSRPALRWTVPIAVLALALLASTGVPLLRADAAGALPPRTAEQLLVDLQTAEPEPLSGTAVYRADLGLPALPIDAGEGSSDLSSLVSGTHTLKVWYDGPQRTRLALLGNLGESDVIRNGRDLWIWSSQEQSATHHTVSAEKPGDGRDKPPGLDPSQLPRTPEEAAEQVLAALDPTTEVTTDGTARVADRAAYQLVLRPRDTNSLIGEVRLAVDADKQLPLQVQVFADGATEPAFQVGFTDLNFGRPEARQFEFTPPAGTKVTEAPADHDRGDGDGGEKAPDQLLADRPTVVGEGWTAVVVAQLADPAKDTEKGADDPGNALRQSLPEVSGAWGSGRLLRGALFTALVTDDGQVLAGAVRPERLFAVAGQTQ